MKHLLALTAVVAAAMLSGVAACGGEDQLSRQEFSDRIQSIGEQGGELWARLAEQAQDLEPGEQLPAGIKQALTELVEFQKQAAAELEGMKAPEEAEAPLEMLTAALRERTETFEQVIAAGRFTKQDSERVTQAGEAIDEAFEQLRSEGFLAAADEHEEE
jgi:hypothetical protein